MYLKPSARRKFKIRLIIIAAALAAAAGVFALLYFAGLLPGATLFGTDIHPVDYSLPENVIANSNGLLYNQGNTLFYADKNGSVIWEQQLEMQDSSTAASDELICNYAGKSLQVMKYDKSLLFSTNIESEIIDVAVGKAMVAVLTQSVNEQQQLRSYISLFSTVGDQTGQQIDFSERQVTDFGFYGDNDMFWALALDTSGVVPVSIISTYKSDGSMTSNIQETTQIVESVFLTDTAIFSSGTKYLTSYSYFGERQAEDSIHGWKEAASWLTPQTCSLAYIPRSSESDIDVARVYSADLSYSQIRLPAQVFSVAVTAEKLYAFAPEKIYAYFIDGTPDKTTDLNYTLTAVKQVSDNQAVLWSASESYIMDLT